MKALCSAPSFPVDNTTFIWREGAENLLKSSSKTKPAENAINLLKSTAKKSGMSEEEIEQQKKEQEELDTMFNGQIPWENPGKNQLDSFILKPLTPEQVASLNEDTPKEEEKSILFRNKPSFTPRQRLQRRRSEFKAILGVKDVLFLSDQGSYNYEDIEKNISNIKEAFQKIERMRPEVKEALRFANLVFSPKGLKYIAFYNSRNRNVKNVWLSHNRASDEIAKDIIDGFIEENETPSAS